MVHTYGTNMQQSVWQLFSHFFFFKPNYNGNSAKGEGVGRTRAFHRALAKIHSKKFKFYTKHLTLRVYKKCFLLGSGRYLHKLFTKKVVCSVFTEVYSIFSGLFFSIYFPKKVNKAIVTTQDPYTIQTLMYLQFSYLQKYGAKLLSQVTKG